MERLFRISYRNDETVKGYFVEYKTIKHRLLLRNKVVWKTLLTYRGSDDVYYFDTAERALLNLQNELRFLVTHNYF